MNAAEIFAAMAGSFRADKAGALKAVFQFNLSGEGGGSWNVSVADGACQVAEGKASKADVTVAMAAPDFVKMIGGELQPVAAFMQGKIKLQGDMAMAMKLQELFIAQ
jgi:putative sterol carrier protein